ncbi:hypothetical protein AX16_010719 [Volvariella volvacea WC 439]|nr:hypothetical protein AX16_010719 [Volvariella volvacea WC 439]
MFIPTELVEHIIGFAADPEDIKTLNSCAIASRRFLPITRAYRYSSMTITCSGDPTPLQDFAQLLHTFPWASDYVKSFSFVDKCAYNQTTDPDTYKGPWVTVEEDDDGNTTIRKDLPTILKSLPKLRKLHLHAFLVNYLNISDALKQALVLTFRLPTLRIVNLVGFEGVPPTLFASTSIKGLQLDHCSFDFSLLDTGVSSDPYSPQLNDANAQAVHIEGLGLTSDSQKHDTLGFLFHMQCPLNLTSLRRFDIEVDDERKNLQIAKILDGCKDSLEFLSIRALSYTSDSFKFITLTSLKNLKHVLIAASLSSLKSIFKLHVEDRLFFGLIIQLSSLLCTLPGLSNSSSTSSSKPKLACPLKSITLLLSNSVHHVIVPSSEALAIARVGMDFYTQAWERLDDILTTLVTSNGDHATRRGVGIRCHDNSSHGIKSGPLIKICCMQELHTVGFKQFLKRCYDPGKMEVITLDRTKVRK